MTEPHISINGVVLSEGQSMAVRVACSSFFAEMSGAALWHDDLGRQIQGGYRDRLKEVLALICEQKSAPHAEIPSQTFGVVADLQRGIQVSGAILCPECGGRGWLHDDTQGSGPTGAD